MGRFMVEPTIYTLMPKRVRRTIPTAMVAMTNSQNGRGTPNHRTANRLHNLRETRNRFAARKPDANTTDDRHGAESDKNWVRVERGDEVAGDGAN